MHEIIKVNYDSENPTVNGRELHRFLEIETPYKKWFDRMAEYGFAENTDFILVNQICSTNNPKNPTTTRTDHTLTIDMAKELCMIQRTDKGKQARQYFIAVEKAWNTPDMIMARALKLMDGKIKVLETTNHALTAQIEADRPKVLFADSVSVAENTILIRDMAKLLKQNGCDTGEKRFYEQLRRDGFLIKQRGIDYNHPTQKAKNLGLFVMKETVITHSNGTVKTYITPRVTGKGQLYFMQKYTMVRQAARFLREGV